MTAEVRKKAAIWLALLFVLGLATGGVFGYNLARHVSAATRRPMLSEAEHRAKKVEEMTREIGLDADQSKKVDAIIADAQHEIHAIRDKSEEEVDAVRMKARNQMRDFLTPEQKAKFEDFVNRLDSDRKKQKEMQQGH
ncbi:MAG TPA: hypothetical protein VL128_13390 [Candidatus Eisenbacteria bacterium]|nr:hypothetical protein [Candidatus Eisenbacteria bacterium]